MSERREKQRRYNEKLAYIARFEQGAHEEPPMWALWKWRRWLKGRPKRKKVQPDA